MDDASAVCNVLIHLASASAILNESLRSFLLNLASMMPERLTVDFIPMANHALVTELQSLIGIPSSECERAVCVLCRDRYASSIFWDALELQLSELRDPASPHIDGFNLTISDHKRTVAIHDTLHASVNIEKKDYFFAAQHAIHAESPSGSQLQICFVHDESVFSQRQLPSLQRGQSHVSTRTPFRDNGVCFPQRHLVSPRREGDKPQATKKTQLLQEIAALRKRMSGDAQLISQLKDAGADCE